MFVALKIFEDELKRSSPNTPEAGHLSCHEMQELSTVSVRTIMVVVILLAAGRRITDLVVS